MNYIFTELLNYSQQQASMIFYLRTCFQNLGLSFLSVSVYDIMPEKNVMFLKLLTNITQGLLLPIATYYVSYPKPFPASCFFVISSGISIRRTSTY